MPCSGGPSWTQTTIERDRLDSLLNERDALAAMLCSACTQLENAGLEVNPSIKSWWYRHKAEDLARANKMKAEAEKARTKREKEKYLRGVKERLMGQLTPEEKEALGVKGT